MSAERYDVFVSYAHRDAAWVQVLADNLHRAALSRQRNIFGDTTFRRIIGEDLDSESVENLINALPDPDDS